MTWWQYSLIIVFLVIESIVVLIIKHSIPSYLEKKGENLATKQDIAEITRKTEQIQQGFKEELTRFSSDLKFKYDFYYKQYSELYCILYPIIVQSEYVRYFINNSSKQKVAFEDFPFIDIPLSNKVSSKEYDEKTSLVNQETTNFTLMSNKTMIYDTIIKNGRWATQRLLKLAVSYRFAFERSNDGCSTSINTYDEEEFKLIKEITKCIVMEYNFFRRELKMEYSENELKSGQIDFESFKCQ